MRRLLWLVTTALYCLIIGVSGEDEKEIDLGEVVFGEQKARLCFIQGDLAPANWSYFELKWKGPLRLILDSVVGDADLYLSSRKRRPGYHVDEHEMISTTCGLDVIDVPQSLRRPIYVGVYGHPSKAKTSYHLLIVMMEESDSEFVDPIDIAPDIMYSLRDDITADHSWLREAFFATIRFIFEVMVEVLL